MHRDLVRVQPAQHDAARLEGNSCGMASGETARNVVGVDERSDPQHAQDALHVRRLAGAIGTGDYDRARRRLIHLPHLPQLSFSPAMRLNTAARGRVIETVRDEVAVALELDLGVAARAWPSDGST